LETRSGGLNVAATLRHARKPPGNASYPTRVGAGQSGEIFVAASAGRARLAVLFSKHHSIETIAKRRATAATNGLCLE
jgi:hypothetical protein